SLEGPAVPNKRTPGGKHKASEGGPPKKETPSAGLLGGVSAADLGARRTQRLGTVEALKTGRTPLKVIEVAAGATELAEQSIGESRGTNPPPPLACRGGCGWGCYPP